MHADVHMKYRRFCQDALKEAHTASLHLDFVLQQRILRYQMLAKNCYDALGAANQDNIFEPLAIDLAYLRENAHVVEVFYIYWLLVGVTYCKL